MGYTTKFTGQIDLSRELTMAEAKQILEFNEDPDLIPAPHPDSYMQWVPCKTLDAIGWDGNEKFYNYAEWLQWLCDWLAERGINTNGTLRWSGESAGDAGSILVVQNRVNVSAAPKAPARFSPIDLRALGEMALERLAAPPVNAKEEA